MHVSRKAALSLAALGFAAALNAGRPAAAQTLSAGGPLAAHAAAPQPSAYALSQVAALQAEKAGRTPTQAKIDSNLLRAALLARAASVPAVPVTAAPDAMLKARALVTPVHGVGILTTGTGTLSVATMNMLKTIPVSLKAQPDANGMVSVDIEATVTPDLLASITAAGGTVAGSWPAYNSVRATLPVIQLETVAASPAVRSISPAEQAHVVRRRETPAAAGRPGPLVPTLPLSAPIPAAATPAARQSRVKAALPALLDRVRRAQKAQGQDAQAAAKSPVFSLAAQIGTLVNTADPQGDLAQRAALARKTFGVNGTGIKIGVISDSVNGLATEQRSGALGPVTVLTGQSGISTRNAGTGEGTAMLEIVHRLAPGAQLYFATANPTQAQFAANILALQQAGCNVIVDDVGYFAEPPFQDGVINQAIDTVSAAGAFYFSSAGNDFNQDQDGITATWEGDWRASGLTLPLATPTTKTGSKNDLGAPMLAFDSANHYQNQVLTDPNYPTESAYLSWADPQGTATDDYDLVVFNSTFTAVLYSSTNIQSGTQNPIEACSANQGNIIVIVKASGNGVLLHLYETSDGAAALTYSTPSGITGHAGSNSCFTVAAADASIPYGQNRSFQSTDVTEYFSSDGPRRIIFTAAGAEITPGNRSSTGGVARQKPVLASSDGVTAFPSGGFTPFYGTSAAAPHAAAIAALALAADPRLAANAGQALTAGQAFGSTQMFGLLTGACIPFDTTVASPMISRDTGAGLLDAYNAVGSAITLYQSGL